MTQVRFSQRHRTTTLILFNAAAILFLFLSCEGAASVLNAIHIAFRWRPQAERFHTKYDPEIGWVNIPNIYLPDVYGPGKSIRIDSQGFRSSADFAPTVPPNQTRIICSGDSFTLGYGVDNDHAWPQLLESQSRNIQTVNMGQAGYGADQAYLWFKRDGAQLDHSIHILALIGDDFRRMQLTSFNGFGKPVLAVENGELVPKNVPVPRIAWSSTLARFRMALGNTCLMRFCLNRLNSRAAPPAGLPRQTNNGTILVLGRLLDDLRELNRARNSALVLVYLPVRDESRLVMAPWRRFLSEYAKEHDVLYLDLVEDFHGLTLSETDSCFIPEGGNDRWCAGGHYSEHGNAFVADLIYHGLLEDPHTRAFLHE